MGRLPPVRPGAMFGHATFARLREHEWTAGSMLWSGPSDFFTPDAALTAGGGVHQECTW
jgi:hypothetical protein